MPVNCHHRPFRLSRWRAWLLAALSLGLAAAGPAAESYPLNPDHFIVDWLVGGPYPSYEATPAPTGFAEDLLANLGGEAKIEPYAGQQDKAVFIADKAKLIAGIGSTNEWGFTETKTFDVAWRELHWQADQAKKESPDIVSLDNQFSPINDNLVAYVACYLVSPGELKVQFRLGSDDGYKLWVNHEYVGGLDICRGIKPDDNIHLVQLHKGLNPVLLKVVDRRYGHGFCLAVTDGKGNSIPELSVRLDNPKVRLARECANLETVDALDETAFGGLGLAGAEPYFPGRHNARIGLALTQTTAAEGEVLVTDAQSRPLLRQNFAQTLEPKKAFWIEAPLEVTTAGRLTLAAVIKEKGTGRLLGQLERQIEILSPEAISQKLAAARDELAAADQQLADLRQKQAAAEAQIKAVRAEIAGQYAAVESQYAARRAALTQRYGPAGSSISEPFKPESTERAELCLNGDAWELAPAKCLDWKEQKFDRNAVPAKGWISARVPNLIVGSYFRSWHFPVQGKGDKFYGPSETMPCGGDFVLPDVRTANGVWYRLSFELPAGWEKRQLTLRLENAMVDVRLFVNGQLAGEELAWCGSRRFALPALRPGGNRLEIYVGSARACGYAANGFGLERCWGLMGDVQLEAAAPVRVDEVWVQTSVRDARIAVQTWLQNAGPATSAEVEQYCVRAGQIQKRIDRKTVELPAGQTTEVTLAAPWTDPELWGIGGEYGEPTLYDLVTDVKVGGRLVDRHVQRFGFREFWSAGHHFYLNGKRLFLQGENGHFHQNIRRQLETILPLLRADGINLIRAHQGSPEAYSAPELPRLADECGMLVCAQMYPLLYPGATSKEAYYKAHGDKFMPVAEFLQQPIHAENLKNFARWVRLMRNHPSVIVYSTDNEIFTQAWDTKEQLAFNIRNDQLGAVYGQYVKSLDPTRLITRDGDEGTWGHKGKWQEEPPCDTANYHYPDFVMDDFVRNWETVYDGRPVIFGETLYHSYGAWDGWVGAQPGQVTAKANKVREVVGVYRDLEIPGAVFMGLSLDGFIELDPAGCGPWKLTPELLAEGKANRFIKSMPRYPFLPIAWPCLSGPGQKPEFAGITAGMHGEKSINWFDPGAPSHVRNAVNDAYRDTLRPMPPLAAPRSAELIVHLTRAGQPVAHQAVFLRPAANQAGPELGVETDAAGKAWFLAPQSGAYELSAGPLRRRVELTAPAEAMPAPGFAHIPVLEATLE